MKYVHCFNNHKCELVIPIDWLVEFILDGEPVKIAVHFIDKIHHHCVIRYFDCLRFEEK